jgi:hypothetical protein
MPSSRNLLFTLAVAGGIAAAAVLAVRGRARRLEAVQHTLDLQTWENEGGSTPQPVFDEPETTVPATESR